MFRKTLICFATTLLMFPLMVFGYSPYIYAGGENIGIAVKSKGVIIVGSYKVDNEDVISSSDLRVGDIIVSIDSNKITNISDLTKIVSNITKNEIKVGYKRNNVLDYTIEELKDYLTKYETSSNEDCSSYHVAILLYELLEEIEKLVDNKVNLEINKLSELDPLIKNISTINSNEYEFLYNQIKNNIANNYLNNNLIDDKSFDLCIQFMNDIFNYYISGYPDIPDEFLFNKNDNN